MSSTAVALSSTPCPVQPRRTVLRHLVRHLVWSTPRAVLTARMELYQAYRTAYGTCRSSLVSSYRPTTSRRSPRCARYPPTPPIPLAAIALRRRYPWPLSPYAADTPGRYRPTPPIRAALVLRARMLLPGEGPMQRARGGRPRLFQTDHGELYWPMRFLCDVRCWPGACKTMGLRACYAMSGTEVAHAGTADPDVRY
eukprot:2666951-Rhodomonas_salina.5